MNAPATDRFIIPIGPQHPALKEPGHFEFTVEGETVTSATVRLGYAHRGIEKGTESRNWTQNLYLLERICGICSHIHSTARPLCCSASLCTPSLCVPSSHMRCTSQLLYFRYPSGPLSVVPPVVPLLFLSVTLSPQPPLLSLQPRLLVRSSLGLWSTHATPPVGSVP